MYSIICSLYLPDISVVINAEHPSVSTTVISVYQRAGANSVLLILCKILRVSAPPSKNLHTYIMSEY